MATINELLVSDAPESWSECGFAVEGDAARVGGVTIRLVGRDAARGAGGLVGWTLHGLASEALDGLPTQAAASPGGEDPPTVAPAHPNGVVVLDHVVAI